jgi:hypothetical protein
MTLSITLYKPLWSVAIYVLLCKMLLCRYAECRCTECRYAKCRGASVGAYHQEWSLVRGSTLVGSSSWY